jgi:hypothetical protein
MPETLSPQETGPKNNQETDTEVLSARFNAATEALQEIKEKHGDRLDGKSSFLDVTGNIRAVVGSDLRAYIEDGEDGDPEDLEEAQKGLHALESYVQALGNPQILEGELTEAGFDPQLRQEADARVQELHQPAVQIYAIGLAKIAEQMKEGSDIPEVGASN